MPGSLDAWESGCLGVWMPGSLDAWESGSIGLCYLQTLSVRESVPPRLCQPLMIGAVRWARQVAGGAPESRNKAGGEASLRRR
jgi:hypothetical protein